MWRTTYRHADGSVETKALNARTPWMSNLFPWFKGADGQPEAPPPLRVQLPAEALRRLTGDEAAEPRTFGSSEACYQYAKAVFFDRRVGDTEAYAEAYGGAHGGILAAGFPEDIGALESKKAGGKGSFSRALAASLGNRARAKRLYDAILKDWFAVSADVMREVLAAKFDATRNPAYRELLLATGEAPLFEGRRRGGNIWEKGAPHHPWGLLGELLVETRSRAREPRVGGASKDGL